MDHKVILLVRIFMVIYLLLFMSNVNAAYFHRPDIPDYEVVFEPCYKHHRVHHHIRPTVTAASHKHSRYSMMKYYVYSGNQGDLIWVPSPCGCNDAWVEVRRFKSYHGFAEEPYKESRHMAYDDDDVDYDMDMRTSDDVD